MPTLDTLQLPRIDTSAYGGREAKKIAGHLYQVEEQLRYVLGHLDEDNLSDGLKSKIESGGMGSEILQSLDAITLRVHGQDDALSELRVSLGGISTTVQEQGGSISELRQTAESITTTVQANKELSEQQAAAALEKALAYTDGQLENYPTSVQLSSALQQTAESITATVAAVYSTKDELRSTVEQRAESILSEVSANYSTKDELKSTVEQTAGSITQTVERTYATKQSVADGDAATLKSAESKIEQTAGSILSEVSANYSTKDELKSTIEQTAESITSSVEKKVSAASSGNLLKYPNFEDRPVHDGVTFDDDGVATLTGDADTYAHIVEYIDEGSRERIRGKEVYAQVLYKIITPYAAEDVVEFNLRVDYQDGTYAYKVINLTNQTATDWKIFTTGPLAIENKPIAGVRIFGGPNKVPLVMQTRDWFIGYYYPTQSETKSLIKQTAESITQTVEATYATKGSVTDGDAATLKSAQSQISQTATSITNTVSATYATKTALSTVEQTANRIGWLINDGGTSSSFTLTDRAAQLVASSIDLSGKVSFYDLATPNTYTRIIGDNIKTGIIENNDGTTVYDLNNGTIQMGATSGAHVLITKDTIRWYLNANAPTGIFQSVYSSSYIGANSRYTYYGWLPSGSMTGEYFGLMIDHEGYGAAHFSTNKVECGGDYVGGAGYFEAFSAKINGNWIGPVAASLMTVSTKQYGNISLTGAGSASPLAFDNGSGVIGEDGKCWLFLRDEFLSTVSCNVVPQWQVTASAPVTVQKEGLCAVVEGEPGTTFDWLCILPQKGCETLYCEPLDFDMSDGMDRRDDIAGAELSDIELFEENLNNEVLQISKENTFIEETWPGQLERRAS